MDYDFDNIFSCNFALPTRFSPPETDAALKELERLLRVAHVDSEVDIDDADTSTPTEISYWKMRNIFSSERWKEDRPR